MSSIGRHDTCRPNCTLERTGGQLLWSTTLLYLTLLSSSHGFNLTLQTRSLFNHFWTHQGPRRANLHKRGLVKSATSDCGQTINHTVDMSVLTKTEGGLQLLYEAEENAMAGIKRDCSTHEMTLTMLCRLLYCPAGPLLYRPITK